jgi:phage repressor protein C with HTH and peptisase S24 domain
MQAERIGPLVRRLRKRAGLTQGQVENFYGIPRPWLSLVETGRIEKPERERLIALARVFRVEPALLLSAAGYSTEVLPLPAERSVREIVRELAAAVERQLPEAIAVPVVPGAVVSAGPGGYVESVGYRPQPGERQHQFVAVTVVGDGMEPALSEGDIAIIDQSEEPRVGEIVAAERNGEYLIKRLERRNGELWLVANHGQAPIRVSEQVRILGVVKGKFRPL